MIANDFVKKSLDLHLFAARVMKEHAFFLQTTISPKEVNLINQADYLRRSFDVLLNNVTMLSNGVVSPEVLRSGEVITPYTLNAEIMTANYTGVQIPTDITQAEAGLTSNGTTVSMELEHTVRVLNENAIQLLNILIQFKETLLTYVLSCRVFTFSYPALIAHITEEAKHYLHSLQMIQKAESKPIQQEAYEEELFWNHVMGDHAKIIRGLLDPSEEDLIAAANNFSNEFEELENQVKLSKNNIDALRKITDINLIATKQIRDFKQAGTQGILECKIKSIIIPLLADHVLREANHYLRMLNEFKKEL